MTIELSLEVEALLRKQVSAGIHGSENEVLRHALTLLEDQEDYLASHREEIQAKIDEGRGSLERGERIDGEEAIARLFNKLDDLERMKQS